MTAAPERPDDTDNHAWLPHLLRGERPSAVACYRDWNSPGVVWRVEEDRCLATLDGVEPGSVVDAERLYRYRADAVASAGGKLNNEG